MSLNKKPLTPWIIAENNGKVISAHCDCMAGLGESCSHVASLLWAIESGVRIRDSMTVTQKKAYWVIPNGVKEVPYARVRNIELTGKKKCWTAVEKGDFTVNSGSSRSSTPKTSKSRSSTPRASKSPSSTPRASKSPSPMIKRADITRTKNFLASLASCSSKPAILSLVEPHSPQYIPKAADGSLPLCLTTLYKASYLSKKCSELLTISKEVKIEVTKDEVDKAEIVTRSQVQSRLWQKMRAGRITASRFKAVCHTDPSNPSKSLIMSICHPELSRFKTAATQYECEHEATAKKKYIISQAMSHHKFEVKPSGFCISTDYSFIGASPDGSVNCSCCGDGICEIKVINI